MGWFVSVPSWYHDGQVIMAKHALLIANSPRLASEVLDGLSISDELVYLIKLLFVEDEALLLEVQLDRNGLVEYIALGTRRLPKRHERTIERYGFGLASRRGAFPSGRIDPRVRSIWVMERP